MVIDHIEDYFDSRLVKRAYHFLEFRYLPSVDRGSRISGVRSEKSDGAVAPVVLQRPVGYRFFGINISVVEFLNRERLYGGNTKAFQIRYLFYKTALGAGMLDR